MGNPIALEIKMWTFTVFVLVLAALANSVAQMEETEYVLNFDSPLYVCPDEESQAYLDVSEVEVKMFNESTAVMSGTITLLKVLELGTMLEIIIEKDVGGSYTLIMSHEICNLCKEIADPDSKYSDFIKYFGFPPECPFEAGSYTIDEFVPNKENIPLESDTEGHYLVTIFVKKATDEECVDETTSVACAKLNFVIEPL